MFLINKTLANKRISLFFITFLKLVQFSVCGDVNVFSLNKSAQFLAEIETRRTSVSSVEFKAQLLEFHSNAQLNNENFDLIKNVTRLARFKPTEAIKNENPIDKNNSTNQGNTKPFVFLCIVYTLSTLSAIILNLIVILVYLFGRSARTDLSIFLINLAIADFVMSTVCMPFTFAQALLFEWIFGEIMCPIGKIH